MASAPVIVGTVYVAGTPSSGHNLVLVADAGAQANDYLLAAMVSRNGGNVVAPPDDTWTPIPGAIVQTGSTSGNLTAGAWYKPFVAGDAGKSFTFTSTTGNVEIAGGLAVIRGADASTFLDVAIGVGTSSSANVANPGVTTETPEDLILGILLDNTDATDVTQPPAGFTTLGQANSTSGSSDVGVAFCQKTQATAGPTGSLQWTSTANKVVNYCIAIRPASTGGGSTPTRQIKAMVSGAEVAVSAVKVNVGGTVQTAQFVKVMQGGSLVTVWTAT